MERTLGFPKIAVLIDAENARADLIGDVLTEISKLGRVVVKRAYGNWAAAGLKSWESETKRLGIAQTHQPVCAASGKNAADIRLTVDAMKLAATGEFDAFVIVASDSDYTPLATELRERGIYVAVVGEEKTPETLRGACVDFWPIGRLGDKNEEKDAEIERGDAVVFFERRLEERWRRTASFLPPRRRVVAEKSGRRNVRVLLRRVLGRSGNNARGRRRAAEIGARCFVASRAASDF